MICVALLSLAFTQAVLSVGNPNESYELVYNTVWTVKESHHKQFIEAYKQNLALPLAKKYNEYLRHQFFIKGDEVHIAEWISDSNVWKLQILGDNDYAAMQDAFTKALDAEGVAVVKSGHYYWQNEVTYAQPNPHYSQNDQIAFGNGPVVEAVHYAILNPADVDKFLKAHDQYITQPVNEIFYNINTGYQMLVLHAEDNHDPQQEPQPVIVNAVSWFSSEGRQWIADFLHLFKWTGLHRDFRNALNEAGVQWKAMGDTTVFKHLVEYDFDRSAAF